MTKLEEDIKKVTNYILNTREDVSSEIAEKVAESLVSVWETNTELVLAGKQEHAIDCLIIEEQRKKIFSDNIKEFIPKIVNGLENQENIEDAENDLKDNCVNTHYIAEEVEFKVKKRPTQLSKKVIATLLTILLAIGALKVAKAIKNYYENNKNEKRIEEMVADIDKKFGVDIASIVSDNVREGTIASTSKETLGYNPTELAGDIIDVCRTNPQLFDVTLHKVFCDLPFSDIKLTHMDIIFSEIKIQIQDDESLNSVYNKIKGYTFLEYIVKSGYVNKNDKNHEQLVVIAESFNKGRNYSDLTYQEKQIVDKVLEEYKFARIFIEEPTVGGRK